MEWKSTLETQKNKTLHQFPKYCLPQQRTPIFYREWFLFPMPKAKTNAAKADKKASLATSNRWLGNQKSSCFTKTEVTQTDHPMKEKNAYSPRLPTLPYQVYKTLFAHLSFYRGRIVSIGDDYESSRRHSRSLRSRPGKSDHQEITSSGCKIFV